MSTEAAPADAPPAPAAAAPTPAAAASTPLSTPAASPAPAAPAAPAAAPAPAPAPAAAPAPAPAARPWAPPPPVPEKTSNPKLVEGPPASWPFAGVLKALLKENLASEWFGIPVDIVALNIPDYPSVITSPMDLGTVKARLEAGGYDHQDRAVDDVRLTFHNAMVYNAPLTAVHKAAKRLLGKFESKYRAALKRAEGGAAKRGPGKKAAGGEPAAKRQRAAGPTAKEVYDQADAEGNPLPVTIDQAGCERILKSLMGHDCAGPFLVPVDPNALEIPDYFDRIKRPMDLGTVKKNLAARHYRTNERFAQDVRQVWSNCISFNGPSTGVSRMAKLLSDKFEGMFQRIA